MMMIRANPLASDPPLKRITHENVLDRTSYENILHTLVTTSALDRQTRAPA